MSDVAHALLRAAPRLVSALPGRLKPNAAYFFVGRPPWAAADPLVGLADSRQGPEKAGQGASRGAGAPPHIVATIRQCRKVYGIRLKPAPRFAGLE